MCLVGVGVESLSALTALQGCTNGVCTANYASHIPPELNQAAKENTFI